MDSQLRRQEKFDTWIARYIINQITSRAKGLSLRPKKSFSSWSKLIDQKCVNMNILGKGERDRSSFSLRPTQWKIFDQKITSRLNKHASRELYLWQNCDYRQCYRINKLGFSTKLGYPNIAWKGKAEYNCSMMQQRQQYLHINATHRAENWSICIKSSYKHLKRLSNNSQLFLVSLKSEWHWNFIGNGLRINFQ